jgi:NAD(P)-dependent dehydrogenase (short-subunit alcohol dehydrogenase family)
MGILERFSLEGKTALVTGGGTGIGRGFAIALAEAGADVAVSGRTAATIEAVAAEVEALGRESLAIVADMRVKKEVDSMMDAVVDAWGKLDIGVNNAGVCSHVAVDEMGEEEWDRVIDTNLKGPFLCSLAQARVMRPNKYGKIINTASISGHIVNRPQDQTHYNTSKAGLIHLTKSLAAEWAADGIYVNSISPGYIRTEMADTPEIAKMHPIWLRDTPVGRLGEVEDLQGALIFLASDTSNFVTGCDLIVDGGFTIW